MGDHDPLRRARRTRGVDHVGGVRRGHLAGHRLRRLPVDLLRLGVQAQQAHVAQIQAGRRPAAGEDDRHSGIPGHEGDPAGGVVGVHGHVGRARLQDRQQADHHLGGALDRHPHPDPGAHPQATQPVGQPVRPGVELGVGQSSLADGQGDRVRGGGRLRLDQVVHAALAVVRHRGVVPLHEHPPLLVRSQNGQLPHRPPRVVGDGREEGAQLPVHQGQATVVEHLGTVLPEHPGSVPGGKDGEIGAGGERPVAAPHHDRQPGGRITQTWLSGPQVGEVGPVPPQAVQRLPHPLPRRREAPAELQVDPQRYHLGQQALQLQPLSLLFAPRQPEVEVGLSLEPGQVGDHRRQHHLPLGAVPGQRPGHRLKPLRDLEPRLRLRAVGATGARVGHQQRLQLRQLVDPEVLVARQALVQPGQRSRRDLVQHRQPHPPGEPVPAGQVRRPQRPAVEVGQCLEDHVIGGRRHLDDLIAQGGDRPRLRPRPAGQAQAQDGDGLAADEGLGQPQWVRVGAEVQRPHQRRQLRRGTIPAQEAGGGRAPVPPEVGTPGQVLGLGPHLARGQTPDQLGEGVDTGLVAAGAERQGGVLGRDGHRAPDQDIALVDALGHHVPDDAVGGLAVQDGPGRGVQPRVPGQRTVVEVDRPATGERDHLGGQEREVVDAEEVVEGRPTQGGDQVLAGIDPLDAPFPGPAHHLSVGGDHAQEGVAGFEQDLTALDRQRCLTDDVGGEGRGRARFAGTPRGRGLSRAHGSLACNPTAMLPSATATRGPA